MSFNFQHTKIRSNVFGVKIFGYQFSSFRNIFQDRAASKSFLNSNCSYCFTSSNKNKEYREILQIIPYQPKTTMEMIIYKFKKLFGFKKLPRFKKRKVLNTCVPTSKPFDIKPILTPRIDAELNSMYSQNHERKGGAVTFFNGLLSLNNQKTMDKN